MFNSARSKFSRVLIVGLSCVILSQTVVQCAQTKKPLPKVAEVPNTVQAIDAAIKRLERAKQGLEGREYMSDDAAMTQEFQSWMDYQGDITNDASVAARIQKIQQEITQLQARKAKLVK
ncbi:MAG: hypothetical protein JWO53_785 [Chlamydiia bacterium]|nr:hypothetical protein [Chlamydiia bacterium]